MAHDRAEIQNTPVAGSFHARHEPATQKKRRDQARVQDTAKLFQSEIHKVLSQVYARAVDQNLRISKSRLDRARQFLDLVFARNVRDKKLRGPALSRNFVADFFQAPAIAC